MAGHPEGDMIRRLLAYRAGAVRPPVSRVVTLDQAPQALSDLADRRTVGKVVVRVADPGATAVIT